MDELLDLMEWTRRRVGPDGLVIILHNTTTPMFALENFSDYVVATEWGYEKWTDRAFDLESGPAAGVVPGRCGSCAASSAMESSTANGRRGHHGLFAIEALLCGVTPWPASDETFALLPRLKPLGEFANYRFADWRNKAVTLSYPRCATAVYSRAGECISATGKP